MILIANIKKFLQAVRIAAEIKYPIIHKDMFIISKELG